MNMNPEFQRNLWLELSLHRLVAMPAILGGIFYFLYLLFGGRGATVLPNTALTLFFGLAVLWGARLASDAVIGEIREHTWDIQRMSSLGPWSMTWGKLLGSTAYAWYGALFCLAVYESSIIAEPERALREGILLLAAGLFAQALALLASLQSVERKATPGRTAVANHLLVGVIAVVPFVRAGFGDSTMVHWYDGVYAGAGFALWSLLIFLCWAIIGVYRHLRGQLQLRNSPLVWMLFVPFAAAYLAGFVQLPDIVAGSVVSARMLSAYLVMLSLAYVMAFVEPKDGIALRNLARLLRTGRLGAALQVMPRWLVTVALVLVFGIFLLVRDYPDFFYRVTLFDARIFVLATFLFLVRDIGIILYFNLGGKSTRADATALLYLLVLYFLLPGIFAALHLSTAVAALSPWRPGYSQVTIVSGLIQAIVMLGMVRARINRPGATDVARAADH